MTFGQVASRISQCAPQATNPGASAGAAAGAEERNAAAAARAAAESANGPVPGPDATSPGALRSIFGQYLAASGGGGDAGGAQALAPVEALHAYAAAATTEAGAHDELARWSALVDGCAKRIEGLSAELHASRDEAHELRAQNREVRRQNDLLRTHAEELREMIRQTASTQPSGSAVLTESCGGDAPKIE